MQPENVVTQLTSAGASVLSSLMAMTVDLMDAILAGLVLNDTDCSNSAFRIDCC